jgi:hypothetical protein
MLNFSGNISSFSIPSSLELGSHQVSAKTLTAVLNTWQKNQTDQTEDRKAASEIIEECARTCAPSLDLTDFKLSVLPQEMWSHLTHVKKLYLIDNGLLHFPNGLEQLTALQVLDLAGNAISVLPPQIEQLTQLKSLSLGDNQLDRLPDEFRNLTTLEDLALYGNQFVALPEPVSYLRQLKSLDLGDNQLTAFPEELTYNFPNLDQFRLEGNPIPEEELPHIAVVDSTKFLTQGGEPTAIQETPEEGYMRIWEGLYVFLTEGCEYVYMDKQKRIIGFRLDEEGEISAFHRDREIGSFEWRDRAGKFLLTSLSLDQAGEQYKRAGIGTAMIKIINEIGYVFVRQPGFKQYNDGSELVNDGPGFARALVKKGLLNWFDGNKEIFDYDDEFDSDDY